MTNDFLFHVLHFPSKVSKEEINTEKAFAWDVTAKGYILSLRDYM